MLLNSFKNMGKVFLEILLVQANFCTQDDIKYFKEIQMERKVIN